MPIEGIDEERVRDCLELVDLHKLVASLPEGIFSNLGNHQDGLSGGQLQRLGVARGLYTRPKLLILDEATSSLDPETEIEVSKSLATLKGELTLFVIAHRLSTVAKADTVFLIDSGQIRAAGTLNQLQRKSHLVSQYMKLSDLSG